MSRSIEAKRKAGYPIAEIVEPQRNNSGHQQRKGQRFLTITHDLRGFFTLERLVETETVDKVRLDLEHERRY